MIVYVVDEMPFNPFISLYQIGYCLRMLTSYIRITGDDTVENISDF